METFPMKKTTISIRFASQIKLSIRAVSPIFSFGTALQLVRKVLLRQDMRSH